MQEVSEREFSEIAGKFSQDFAFKLRVAEEEDGERLKSEEEVELTSSPKEAEAASDEEEFSFSCAFAGGSPISADDIFQDGRILPVYPLFNRDLLFTGDESGRPGALVPPLRKVFVEEEEDSSEEAAGPYCEWKGKRPPAAVVEVSSSEACKKSNSTGFSKLRRFRELVLRSNSDGNDAFVFLNPNDNNNNDNNSARKTEEKTEDNNKRKTKKGKETTPYLVHYARNRAAKEGNKRTSYLPYRVGFFARANGFSRNVHPF